MVASGGGNAGDRVVMAACVGAPPTYVMDMSTSIVNAATNVVRVRASTICRDCVAVPTTHIAGGDTRSERAGRQVGVVIQVGLSCVACVGVATLTSSGEVVRVIVHAISGRVISAGTVSVVGDSAGAIGAGTVRVRA